MKELLFEDTYKDSHRVAVYLRFGSYGGGQEIQITAF
jgi:hypothetical protein